MATVAQSPLIFAGLRGVSAMPGWKLPRPARLADRAFAGIGPAGARKPHAPP